MIMILGINELDKYIKEVKDDKFIVKKDIPEDIKFQFENENEILGRKQFIFED